MKYWVQALFMKSVLPWYQKQINTAEKENYRPVFLMNIDTKFLVGYLQTELKTSKKIIYYDQVGCISEMQVWFNKGHSTNGMYHINELQNRDHIIISIYKERTWDKIQHPFMMKALRTVGIEGACVIITKGMFDRRTVDIILNVGKQKAFPPKSGTRQGCPHFLSSGNKTGNRNKSDTNWKWRSQRILISRCYIQFYMYHL